MPDNPVRALFILPSLMSGGAEAATLNLLRRLDRSKVRPSLFLIKLKGEHLGDVPEDVPVAYALAADDSYPRSFLRVLPRLVNLARRHDVLVGAQELHPVYWSMLVGRLTCRPSVGWVHTMLSASLGFNNLPVERRAVRFAYPRTTRLVGVADGVAADVRRVVPRASKQTTVVRNGVDRARLRARSLNPLPPWATRVPDPWVVAVGRLSHEKGFDLLVRAIGAARSMGSQPSLVILGEGTDRSRLEGLVRELGLSDAVHLPGFDPNPHRFMARARVIAMPSRFEGLPLVLMEAFALGCAVVATDCGPGVQEMLGDGAGLVVPKEDPGALGRAIHRLLADEAAHTRLVAKARERSAEYDIERTTRGWENLLVGLARPVDESTR